LRAKAGPAPESLSTHRLSRCLRLRTEKKVSENVEFERRRSSDEALPEREERIREEIEKR